jgi:hypothetical protein
MAQIAREGQNVRQRSSTRARDQIAPWHPEPERGTKGGNKGGPFGAMSRGGKGRAPQQDWTQCQPPPQQRPQRRAQTQRPGPWENRPCDMRDWVEPTGEGGVPHYTRAQARAAAGPIGQAETSPQYARHFEEEDRVMAEKGRAEKGRGKRPLRDGERDTNYVLIRTFRRIALGMR